MGERLRDAGAVDSIFNSISCSRRAVSTGFAEPNIEDGRAAGAGFVSKGFERGCSSILGRVFGSSATVQTMKIEFQTSNNTISSSLAENVSGVSNSTQSIDE